MVFLIYLALCLIIGLFGMHRKFGFWGYFFGSILLTPVIGLLLVLASDSRPRNNARRKGRHRGTDALDKEEKVDPEQK